MKTKILTHFGLIYFLPVFITLAPGELSASNYQPIELKTRTTAYTHTEADHKVWGKKTAIGTTLRYTKEYTSAAADWSYLPVGTEFRIVGVNRRFVVDDYGGALVGRKTVDLYFPSRTEMNHWGLRHVNIVITKMGDFEQSRKILAPRAGYRHCRAMLSAIRKIGKKVLPELDRPDKFTSLFADSASQAETLAKKLIICDNRKPEPPVEEHQEPLPVFGPDPIPEVELVQVANPDGKPTPAPESSIPNLSHPSMAPWLASLPAFSRIAISYPGTCRKEKGRVEWTLSSKDSNLSRIERVIDPVC